MEMQTEKLYMSAKLDFLKQKKMNCEREKIESLLEVEDKG